MASNIEKIPEVNPRLKISVGSAISNPIPDQEYLTTRGKKNLNITVIFILIDLILTLLIILQEHDFLAINFSDNVLPFLIKSIICIIIFVSIIIIFSSHKYILVKITRFVYIILGTLYYCFKFILKFIILIKAINNEEEDIDIEIIDVIFLFVHLVTIIPRILTFFISKGYVEKLERIHKLQMEEEHEKFVQKIATRLEKGYDRWSNFNENEINEKQNELQIQKQYFDKNENENNNENNNENKNDNNNDKETILFTINGNKEDDDNKNNKFLFDKKEEELL